MNVERIAFLALCGVALVCMTALVATGHNGAITQSLLGISAGLFGVNFWEILRRRDTTSGDS